MILLFLETSFVRTAFGHENSHKTNFWSFSCINSERVLYPNDIGPAIKRAIKSQKPSLIDIVIDGSL